ncbi:Uncharacterised protein [Acholeplasma oculi]|uniref:Uncharacterized protein n=1 Tax=Acholeplasma oculi TaxID=35623 RepID=A0A061AH22_9MOLU|nr:hypothetical protein [Acholeplasma oculi]CDR30232.1 hypothetical protein Aocu_01590 [Acholeplasma oculi]SKC43711.1 hypothetical protein SAMN02745122_1010 [Acholeplasma oculi]SUT88624.1 Uncharacterised protein [Acholeplasma oculi]
MNIIKDDDKVFEVFFYDSILEGKKIHKENVNDDEIIELVHQVQYYDPKLSINKYLIKIILRDKDKYD